jgi:predicted ATP-dependent serine protease
MLYTFTHLRERQKKTGPTIQLQSSLHLYLWVIFTLNVATGKLVKKGVAMTGQLSLKGKVLKVIDAKEKVLIAKREGIREVILPKSNQHEIDILTDDIK